MNTSKAKIARLPKTLRHQLGLRIEDNQPGADIVTWLNAQPDTQAILKDHFEGRPITEQNLSDWKQSGHLDWLRRQEAQQATLQLMEQSQELDQAIKDHTLSDEFATVLASEMTRLAMTLLQEEKDPEKKWQRLCQINRELSHLRRDDHRSIKLSLQQERWDRQVDLENIELEQKRKAARKRQMIDMLLDSKNRATDAELIFGGGRGGRVRAEMLYRIKNDLSMEDIFDGTWEKEEARKAAALVPRQPVAATSRRKPRAQAKSNRKPIKKPQPAMAKSIRHSLVAAKQGEGGSSMIPQPESNNPALASNSTIANAPVPKERKKIAHSFNCGNNAQTKSVPEGRQKHVSELPVKTPAKSQKSRLVQPARVKKSTGSVKPRKPQCSTQSNTPTNTTTSQPASINPPVHQSNDPATPDISTTSPPTIDPEAEAYNRWFRMNRGAEPFDADALEKLYAAVPQ